MTAFTAPNPEQDLGLQDGKEQGKRWEKEAKIPSCAFYGSGRAEKPQSEGLSCPEGSNSSHLTTPQHKWAATRTQILGEGRQPTSGCTPKSFQHWGFPTRLCFFGEGKLSLTHIRRCFGFVEHVGVAGRVLPHQHHAQVGPPVACSHPLLHLVPHLLPDLPGQLPPRDHHGVPPAAAKCHHSPGATSCQPRAGWSRKTRGGRLCPCALSAARSRLGSSIKAGIK